MSGEYAEVGWITPLYDLYGVRPTGPSNCGEELDLCESLLPPLEQRKTCSELDKWARSNVKPKNIRTITTIRGEGILAFHDDSIAKSQPRL